MLDAIGQTGLGGSRTSKNEDTGFFFVNGQIPVINGSGITLEYISLITGEVIDPNLNPWNSQTKIGLRISKSAIPEP
jgi:hypothetical protein